MTVWMDYEKALNEVEDIDLDLKGIFQKMANESRENINESKR